MLQSFLHVSEILKSRKAVFGLLVLVIFTLTNVLFDSSLLNYHTGHVAHDRASRYTKDGKLTRSDLTSLKAAVRSLTSKRKTASSCDKVTHHQGKIKCEKWVVVTTIFNLTDAVKDLLEMPKWCLVLVADKKGPKEVPPFPNLVFLDVAWQERCSYHICQHLPWNHIARKNIGFMYAVANGAKWIYDTDDLTLPKFPKSEPLLDCSMKFDRIQVAGHVYNPYTPYIKPNTTLWPRGLPHDKIKDSNTKNMRVIGTVMPDKIAVVNFPAQTGPDVDTVYRQTQNEIPFPFEMVEKYHTLPHYVMSPYNAQATLHAQFAFWGLLLPGSVDGCVSDIWRSYFTQRLVWDIDGHIVFGPPYVNRTQSANSYMADFRNEMDVYSKTSQLIKFLVNWIPKSVSLAQNMVDLYIELYQIDIIGRADIDLAIAWIRDLDCVGYTFPPVKVAKDFVYLIQGPSVTMLDGLVSNSDRDVLWLTYKTESGAYLYRPDSTWTIGRNLLLEHAAERGSRMSNKGYKYFIFLDDDAGLSFMYNGRRWNGKGGCKSDVVWTCFELFLAAYEPAVSYPHYILPGHHFFNESSLVNLNYPFDAMAVAYHRDTLSFLMPYSAEFEARSWWASDVLNVGLANMLYSSSRYQYNVLHSNNLRPSHPGNTRYKTNTNRAVQLQYVLSALQPTVDGKPNPLLNSTSPNLALRVQGKANLKKDKTYIADYAFVKKYFKLDHNFTQSRLNWLKKPAIKKILFDGKEFTEFDNSFEPDYSRPI